MLDKPVVIKDVLDIDLFIHLNDTMNMYMRWKLNNRSYAGKEHVVSWGTFPRNGELLFFKAATIIKLKLLKHLRHKIQLVKIHYNGQTSGQTSEFHSDFDEDLCWTFVLFTEKEWDTQWGGEFVCQHPETDEYFYVPYIPNTGVLIPAHWQHMGQPPIPCTDSLRTTVAFSYMEWNTINEKPEGTTNWDIIHSFL